MWDKYGELTADEINELARKMRSNGDKDKVYELAEENGIDKEMADIFVTEDIHFICDKLTAASGKLAVELEHYQKQYVANALEVRDALESYMSRDRVKLSVHKYGVDIDIDVTGDELADAIRQKGKVLNDILKDVFTRAGKIHAEGNPASALVVPMVIHEYLQPVKEKKEDKKK